MGRIPAEWQDDWNKEKSALLEANATLKRENEALRSALEAIERNTNHAGTGALYILCKIAKAALGRKA
jgi:regulator of replication initiation timing